MLVIYEINTGNIVGINTNDNDTFDSMYRDAPKEFKEKYAGLLLDYDENIANNYKNYIVVNGQIEPKKDLLISEAFGKPTSVERRLTEVELALAAVLGGA